MIKSTSKGTVTPWYMCCTVPQEYSCTVPLPCMSSLYQTYVVSLAIIWIVSITLLLCIISMVRHIYQVIAASARIKQMESSCEGPVQSTAWNKEGKIVPVVRYLKEDRKSIMNKRGDGSEEGERRGEEQGRTRERLQQSNSFVMKNDYDDSLKLLEMHMEQHHNGDDDKILDSDEGGPEIFPNIHISPSETIIHKLCNIRMSNVSVCTPNFHHTHLEIPLTLTPLSPSYLPSHPVSFLWSSSQPCVRLCSYPHIERIVYPPGYVQDTQDT